MAVYTELSALGPGTVISANLPNGGLASLPGRNVFVYLRGTTTQANVFANSNGTGLLNQPLTTDALGEVPGWVLSGVEIDLFDATTSIRISPQNITPSDIVGTDGTIGGSGARSLPANTVTDAKAGGATPHDTTGITQGQTLLYNSSSGKLTAGSPAAAPANSLGSSVTAGTTSLPLALTPGADITTGAKIILDAFTPQAEVVRVLSVAGSTVTTTAGIVSSHSSGALTIPFHGNAYPVEYWGVYPSAANGTAPYLECWPGFFAAVYAVSGIGGSLLMQPGVYTIGFPLDVPTETKLQGAHIDSTAIYVNPNGTAISATVATGTGVFTANSHGLVNGQPIWLGASSLPFQLSVSSVNTPANTLTITSHGLQDQQPIRVSATGTFPTTNKGYDSLFTLHAHVVDANTIQLTVTPGGNALALDNTSTGITVFGFPVETVLYVTNVTTNTFTLSWTVGGTTITPNTAGSGVAVYTTAWRYVQDYPANRFNIAALRIAGAGAGGLPTRFDTSFGGTGRLFLRDMKFTGSATDGTTGVQYANGLLLSQNQPGYIDQVRISTFTSGYAICECGTQQAQRQNLMTTRNMINRWYRGSEFEFEFGADAENSGRADMIFDMISGQAVTIAGVSGTSIQTSTAHGRSAGDIIRFSGVGPWPSDIYPAATGGSHPFISPGRLYSIVSVIDSTHVTVCEGTSGAGPALTLVSPPSGLRLEFVQNTQSCTSNSIYGVHNEPATKVVISAVATNPTNTLTITNHGFSEFQAVRMYPNTTPPAPLVADTTMYYVHVVDANTIQLAATPGGSVIALTTTGTNPGISQALASIEVYSCDQIMIENNHWSPTDYCAKIKVFGGCGSSKQQSFATFRLRHIALSDSLCIGVDSDDHPLIRAASVNTVNGNITLTQHGLLENQPITIAAASFPTGITANTYYYSHTIDNNTIQLRTSQGGTPITSYASAGTSVTVVASGGWSGNWFNGEISDFIAGPYGGASNNLAITYGMLLPTFGGGYTGLGTGSNAPGLALQAGAGQTSNLVSVLDSTGTLQMVVSPAGQLQFSALKAMSSANESTGAGSAALGANCPAVTVTAPYKWEKITTSDGSTCFFPVWK